MLAWQQELAKAGEFKRADAVLDAWLIQYPDDLPAVYARAGLFIDQGMHQQALPLLQELISKEPDNPDLLNSLATTQGELGLDEALGTALRALEIAPKQPKINDTYGWLLVKQGRQEEALGYLREATARLGDDPSVRTHLGIALADLGRDAEAASELRAALRSQAVFPERALAQERLAVITSR